MRPTCRLPSRARLFAMALAPLVAIACGSDSPAASGSSDQTDVTLDGDHASPDLLSDAGPDAIDTAGDVAASDTADEASADVDDGGEGLTAADGNDDSAADGAAADTGPAEDVVADADGSGADPSPGDLGGGSQIASLTIDLQSDGGFTGWGNRDYHYEVGTMTVHYPYATPSDCGALLTEDQVSALYAAVDGVDWTSLESDYLPPDNPSCCCDQFTYAITVDVSYVNGDPISASTAWCTQSVGEELLPEDFSSFLDVLDGIGTQIIADCTGI